MCGNSAFKPPSSNSAPRRSGRTEGWSDLDVGRMHARFEQVAFSVHKNVPLAAGHLLAPVIATRAAGLGGACGLTVDDRGRGLSFAASGHTMALAQAGVDLLPGAPVEP